MKILVITRAAWRDDNNTGSTMSNFFADIPADWSVYSLYCRAEAPENTVAKESFQISEYALLKSLWNRKPVGLTVTGSASSAAKAEENAFRRGRRMGQGFVQFAREWLWTFGNWKSQALDTFLERIQPDVVFMMTFDSVFPYKILRYVQKKTGAEIVLFHADATYTLRQFSLSPFFWVERLALRRYVRRAIAHAALNYSITQEQCEEYAKKFGKPFYRLTKSERFAQMPPKPQPSKRPVQLVYTGNLDKGRTNALQYLVDALMTINSETVRAQLHIYAGVVQDARRVARLCVPGISFFHGAIPANEIPSVHADADILVYTEGLDLQSRLKVRQSFSSKLVDYFAAARCILAIGPVEAAALQHLLRADAAIVVGNPSEIEQKLENLIEEKPLRDAYAEKAWQCGKVFHSSTAMRTQLYEQLSALEKD